MTSEKSYRGEQRTDVLWNALAPVIPADPWNVLTLINGWTGGCNYRFMPGGLVQVEVSIATGAATAFQFGTMPAAYRPSGTKYIAAGASGNVAANVAPLVQVTAAGAVSMTGVSAFAVAATWGASGFYRL